ncbi:MAG: galactose mutarotase [Candidatus Cellulosilyticum pullistercoris]|uniref:Aldose 1-epimerase n=1 Tax=Candidatus Cellulosilyticum pullistercoris TaxID=2838521 RepID=A0A9E2NLL0_9FIRM|nr:galactose mutarotase [Candidatus Cellulosilyticum pullistercoris]
MKKSSQEIVLESGRKITKFSLENDKGMQIEVLSLGATLIKVMVPDKDHNIENVVLGWQDMNVYEAHPGNCGAIIGRVAGRIYKGEFTLEGKKYHLPRNHFKNTLHGGINGFHTKNWEGLFEESSDHISLKMSYLSRDNEEGFPGNLKVMVTYTLSNTNELTISYEAITDKETLVNLTNHAYFNLSGDAKRDIYEQELYIDSDAIYELDEELIPTGNMLSLENEPYFDFRIAKKLGQDIDKENEQLKNGHGYDHIWKLNQGKEAISLYDSVSKRCMTITTSEPCVIVYTMNEASESFLLSNGMPQRPRLAVCFETQKAAVGYHEINKQAITLKPDNIYKQQTTFRFFIK